MSGANTCLLCLQSAANHRRSHYIPKGLWNDLRKANPKIIYKKTGVNVFAERKFGGDYYYDDYLYCVECEKYFGELDDYGVRILRNSNYAKIQTETYLSTDFGFEGRCQKKYLMNGLNFNKFARFIYSIFFRIHCSRQSATSKCKFSPSFTGFLRDLVRDKLPFSDLTLPIVIRNSYDSKSELEHVVPPPEIYTNPQSGQLIVQLLVQGTAIYLIPSMFVYEQLIMILREERPFFYGISSNEFEALAKRTVFSEVVTN